MKNTFNELTVGDIIYMARKNSMTYEKKQVNRVESNQICFGYSDDVCPRFIGSEQDIKEYSRYSSDNRIIKLFVKESDAIRYCKAQMMKNLFSKIKQAKLAIDEVRKFRLEHYELLNHDWTELQIQKLESDIR